MEQAIMRHIDARRLFVSCPKSIERSLYYSFTISDGTKTIKPNAGWRGLKLIGVSAWLIFLQMGQTIPITVLGKIFIQMTEVP